MNRASVYPAPRRILSKPRSGPRQTGDVIAARFFRDESGFSPRAADHKLLSDASITGMAQIHQGLRTALLPALPPLMRKLAMADALAHGIKHFSPWAADVTAIQFGRPEFARKLTMKPPSTLFFEQYGLVPIPPEDDYIDCFMRLRDPLYLLVADLGKKANVTTPQCVINGLAHHLRCAEMLSKYRQEALIHVA